MAERIVVKLNGPQVLRSELLEPSWPGEPVALGVACDPYQASELSYRLTRQALALFLGLGQPCLIFTKSTLVLRDLQLLRALAQRGIVQVQISLCALEEVVWHHVEPLAASPSRRLQVLERLAAAGVEAGVVIAPILPDLTDSPEQLEAVVRAAADHGARFLAPNVSRLTPGSLEWYQPHLRELYPHMMPQYLRHYQGPYPGASYTQEVLAQIEALRQRYHLPERPPLAPSTARRGQLALSL